MQAGTRHRLVTWSFILFFATTFYGTGGGMVESFVNYPSWRAIGPAEWAAYRQSYGALLPVFVIPFFLSLAFKVLIVVLRPPNVPRWAVWTILVMHLFAIVVTVGFIIPKFQVPLAARPDPVLIDGLITYDLWLRGIPGLVTVVLALYVAAKVMGTGEPAREPKTAK